MGNGKTDPTLVQISTLHVVRMDEGTERLEEILPVKTLHEDVQEPETEYESNETDMKARPKDIKDYKTRQTVALTKVSKKRNEIVNLMTDESNLHLVKDEFETYNNNCVIYQDAHSEFCEVLVNEDDLDHETRRYEERQKAILDFRSQVVDWIRKAEECLSDQCDGASGMSRSSRSSRYSRRSRQSRSSRSSRSSQSSSSALTLAKARIAELNIEKEMLPKQQQLKFQEDKFRLDMKIAKAKAREKVLAANQDTISQNPDSRLSRSKVPEPFHKVGENTAKPRSEASKQVLSSKTSCNQAASTVLETEDHPGNVMSTLNVNASPFQLSTNQDSPLRKYTDDNLITTGTLLTALSLPQPEIPKFSGDLVNYRTFVTAFDTRIASRMNSNADKLYYLEQHLLGEPKEIVSACMHMDPECGYYKARELLDKQYGDPYKLAMLYMQKLNEWPSLRQDDNIGLKQLSFFLMKCCNVMHCMSYLDVLNNPSYMLNVVKKLPFYLQNKWRELVSKARRFENKVLSFHDLAEFVEIAADTANDPVYGQTALTTRHNVMKKTDEDGPNHNKTTMTRQKSSTFATSISGNTPQSDNNDLITCPLCHQYHDLESCAAFLEKSVNDRRAFLKDNHLCFGCYGSDHMSKGCIRKRLCQTCGKRHPTALHIDGFKLPINHDKQGVTITDGKNHGTIGSNQQSQGPRTDPKNVKSAEDQSVISSICTATSIKDNVVLHAILPVRIYQKGHDKVVSTYCFYDNGSSGCFLTDEMYERIGASGTNTNLRLKTMHGSSYISSIAVNDLVITDIHGENSIDLPRIYTRQEIPIDHEQIPRPEIIQKYKHLQRIVKELSPFLPDLDVGILVGNSCPEALEPLEVIPQTQTGPYAIRLRHGWTVHGPISMTNTTDTTLACHRVMVHETETVKELLTCSNILRMFEQDFNIFPESKYPGERGLSVEDEKFMNIVQQGTSFAEGSYTVPFPFRTEDPSLPNNKAQALKRAAWQKRKMINDPKYYEDYKAFMKKLMDNSYAERVPANRVQDTAWYLPHHGIYNVNKPGKIRVVFDCSAKFMGRNLNDCLLQGPDLTNNLVGVLIRFRHDSIAFSGDIESMFYQVKVPVHQRKFLRFLWWPDGNINSDMEEFQMCVHIFGAISSPSVANYILRLVGTNTTNHIISETIHRNFYVDDCLKSVESSLSAIRLIEELRKACIDGGFRLTKFISNSYEVMKSIPKDEQAKEVSTLDLNYDSLPVTRALGVYWSVEKDQFGFSITQKDKPTTRRGVLAVISSLYDPLGFLAPVILPAKKILQDLCKESRLDWDDEMPVESCGKWQKWLSMLPQLHNVHVNRCFKPIDKTKVKDTQLHVFSDASASGYGCVAYLRLVDDQQQTYVSFVAGKARLAPLKAQTIPRLELTAAVTAVQLACLIGKEIDNQPKISFHTDSSTVLHYIAGEKKRFPVFVTNRVQLIRQYTKLAQWRYIKSELNPADEASRGLSVQDLLNSSRWLKGPEFLYMEESKWPTGSWPMAPDQGSDPDAETEMVYSTQMKEEIRPMNKLTAYFSSWRKLIMAIAVYAKVKTILKSRVEARVNQSLDKSCCGQQISVSDLEEAELSIFKWLHHQVYPTEVGQLNSVNKGDSGQDGDKQSRVKQIGRNSSLYRLDPFLDNGILRVGGRLRRALLPDYTRHPIILPRNHHITVLIMRHAHERLGHVGRNHMLSELRNKYWIIRGNSAVRHFISKCVKCRRHKGPILEQKMADLPSCRVDHMAPPFYHTGVDYFGPFIIKERRKEIKQYGVLFTCLSSRAVHLEVANSLETDSFINALRRFIARRGNIRELRSDNGTNFIGAEKELQQALAQMDQDMIKKTLLDCKIDWIFNPPSASHMGGSWERMIRSVRKILSGIMLEHGTRLNTESLQTLLCEVEAVINSRPLTNMSDSTDDLEPLSPNHILTGRSVVTVPPPGVFQRADIYIKRRWRQVQYLANLFWYRWRNEYLLSLQARQKWTKHSKNLGIGDVVVLKDDTQARNMWPLGIVDQTEQDDAGDVRAVKVRTQSSVLRRPIHKLVLLLANNE